MKQPKPCQHEFEHETERVIATNPKYKRGDATIKFLICKKCNFKKAMDMEVKQ